MAKRANSGAISSPPAKRSTRKGKEVENEVQQEEESVANSTNEAAALERAESALKRLDYSTAIQICDQYIEARVPSSPSFLMLRSSARTKTGQFILAAQDAERAAKETASARKVHLSAGFNYLQMAKHHFDQASQEEVETSPSLRPADLDQIRDSLLSIAHKGEPSLLHGIPSEVILRLLRCLDSPSLVKFAASNTIWRTFVLGSPQLFQRFEMAGQQRKMEEGLNYFGERCDNKIEAISLMIPQTARPTESVQLLQTIKDRHSSHLKFLSVEQPCYLERYLVPVVESAPLLKVFISKINSPGYSPGHPRGHQSLELPARELEVLIWESRHFSLLCNDRLLQSLTNARTVRICSSEAVDGKWVVELLSRCKRLQVVEIPTFQNYSLGSIPQMNCEGLVKLWLRRPITEDPKLPSTFFSKLTAPKLRSLTLSAWNPQDLSSIPSDSRLKCLSLDQVPNQPGVTDKTFVFSLVQAIKDWKDLSKLVLWNMDSKFAETLVGCLTPLSRESVEAKCHQSVPIPGLQHLHFVRTYTIDGRALASLISARRAVSLGLSTLSIMSAANGMDVSNHVCQGEEPETELRCGPIEGLQAVAISANDTVESWLKENTLIDDETTFLSTS